jgi:hypothetical protein
MARTGLVGGIGPAVAYSGLSAALGTLAVARSLPGFRRCRDDNSMKLAGFSRFVNRRLSRAENAGLMQAGDAGNSRHHHA